ncbi:uncharacterized protein LOC128952295 [Oppia nitens]|uniref:uncharacterized protein LOC128952295 n=1 Tax=Oppia nitens TaxID=1686743 RepID=UPI0023DB349F|nr:uncharacterized protein LOC128952295 [Oppia nitens]XP_054153635.1 uncharacterized protein LOC128952295 [Oppia nitens]
MTDKAWNDPPLFSLDQMSKPSNNLAINRRNRYPQMATAGHQPPTNMTSNTMYSTSDTAAVGFQTQPMMNTTQMASNVQTNVANFGPNFDINSFIYTIHSCITSANIPQELIQKWYNIQNSVYSIQMDGQTMVGLQSLMNAIQSRDFNSGRQFATSLLSNNQEIVRNVGHTISEILRFYP